MCGVESTRGHIVGISTREVEVSSVQGSQESDMERVSVTVLAGHWSMTFAQRQGTGECGEMVSSHR